MTCNNCGRPYDAAALTCPYCRATAGSDGLARIEDDDRVTRAVTASLLARYDAGADAFLARDLDGPLALGELRDAVARVDRSDPSVTELEASLASEMTVALDGIALSDLFDTRSADLKVIRRGLAFLRNRRWREALEWWSLHREALDAAAEHRRLLFLLLEAFTHRLAGDRARAGEIQTRIAAHPVYRAARGATRR